MHLFPLRKKFDLQIFFDAERQLDNKRRLKFDELLSDFKKSKTEVKHCLQYLKQDIKIIIFKEGLDIKGENFNTMMDILNKLSKILDVNLDSLKYPIKIEYKVYYSNNNNEFPLSEQINYLNNFIQPKKDTILTGIKYSDIFNLNEDKFLLTLKLDVEPSNLVVSGETVGKVNDLEYLYTKIQDYFQYNFENACIGDDEYDCSSIRIKQ